MQNSQLDEYKADQAVKVGPEGPEYRDNIGGKAMTSLLSGIKAVICVNTDCRDGRSPEGSNQKCQIVLKRLLSITELRIH